MILTVLICGLGVGILVAMGWGALLLWVPGRMIVHTVGTVGRKLLGNGSFVSGHCNCGHVVGCVLLSNAISKAMQFAGCALLLAV